MTKFIGWAIFIAIILAISGPIGIGIICGLGSHWVVSSLKDFFSEEKTPYSDLDD